MMVKKLACAFLVLMLTAAGIMGFAEGLTLPADCTRIEEAAFQDCVKLTGKLVIPEDVKEIGERAFNGCTGLTGVPVIPETVKRIGAHAFDGCTGLSGRLRLPEAMEVDATAFANCGKLEVVRGMANLQIAVIADMGGFEPGTFNAMAYQPAKAWCKAHEGVLKRYAADEGKEAAAIAKAVKEGAEVIILTGFEFREALDAAQKKYPEVRMVGLDMMEDDLESGVGKNVFLASYREDLSGFMAGYAAVRLGYTHLGFAGGWEIPAVINYGSGFVHGANQAAKELKLTDKVVVEYSYFNSFMPTPEITDQVEKWYKELGVQVVFPCGGGIYGSAGEAAQRARAENIDAKVIGVDTDQASVIDGNYGEGITITSAMKGLDATVRYVLDRIEDGKWNTLGGKAEVLGMASTEPEENFAQLAPSTRYNDGFQYADYKTLVRRLLKGTYSTEGDVSIKVNR